MTAPDQVAKKSLNTLAGGSRPHMNFVASGGHRLTFASEVDARSHAANRTGVFWLDPSPPAAGATRGCPALRFAAVPDFPPESQAALRLSADLGGL
jgi:hypothetical protein